jgi:hypothetical protein
VPCVVAILNPFSCLLFFFKPGLYIHHKEAKKEGGGSAGCTTTANFRFLDCDEYGHL